MPPAITDGIEQPAPTAGEAVAFFLGLVIGVIGTVANYLI